MSKQNRNSKKDFKKMMLGMFFLLSTSLRVECMQGPKQNESQTRLVQYVEAQISTLRKAAQEYGYIEVPQYIKELETNILTLQKNASQLIWKMSLGIHELSKGMDANALSKELEKRGHITMTGEIEQLLRINSNTKHLIEIYQWLKETLKTLEQIYTKYITAERRAEELKIMLSTALQATKSAEIKQQEVWKDLFNAYKIAQEEEKVYIIPTLYEQFLEARSAYRAAHEIYEQYNNNYVSPKSTDKDLL